MAGRRLIKIEKDIYPQITQINADYFLLYLYILFVCVCVGQWLIFNLFADFKD